MGNIESSSEQAMMDTPNLKMFTSAELMSATRNLSPDTVLGEGGFGTVFKGWVRRPSSAWAWPSPSRSSAPSVPRGCVSGRRKISHPNLVTLLGYCREDEDLFLVYEYLPKGSLENHLFRMCRRGRAIGAARGLDHLHTSEKSVIYRDFKTSSILLDADFNAKLSNFGLVKLGPDDGFSHVTTRLMGTYGYAAPEYLATGHLYVKSDVYGFGVVLLELLTGLRVMDKKRPTNKRNLVEWAKSSLSNSRKLKKIMDPRLGGHYPKDAAFLAGELILKCLHFEPKNMPSMSQVPEDFEKINVIKHKPKSNFNPICYLSAKFGLK